MGKVITISQNAYIIYIEIKIGKKMYIECEYICIKNNSITVLN